MSNPNTGPVKLPPPEHKSVASDVADLLGTGPRVGDAVYYRYQPGPDVWASIVVQVKENDILDLICFRPDGNTVRLWGIPKESRLQVGNCWLSRD